MYYVIKRNISTPMSCFLGFVVPKYTVGKNSENVIFEFVKNGKAQRKWVKKEEIVLLTEDKAFFLKTLKQFQAVEATQQKLVDEAQTKLSNSIETFTETVNAKLDEFDHVKNADDVPCLLKDL